MPSSASPTKSARRAPAEVWGAAAEPGPATLRDGSTVLLRPLGRGDRDAYMELIADMDPEDVRLRFFAPMRRMPPDMAERLTDVDPEREFALAAVGRDSGGQGHIYGIGRLYADPGADEGEFAVIVRSDRKGNGLGTALMERVLAAGRVRGLVRIYGDVLHENRRMRALARALGFRATHHPSETGAVRMVLDLVQPERADTRDDCPRGPRP